MKIRASGIHIASFILSISLMTALAVAVHIQGAHSAEGMLLAIANLPGFILGVWLGTWFGRSDYVLYVAAAVANWLFYVLVANRAALLYDKFKHRRSG
jgi:hypothetical protein